MENSRRLRRLIVGEATWYWTVRQRVRPTYADCRLTITFFAEGYRDGVGRRLSLVFAPLTDRVISHYYFESGTLIRLPDHSTVNLHEPGTARRLLDAAAPILELPPAGKNLEVDGWPYFDQVVDRAGAN